MGDDKSILTEMLHEAPRQGPARGLRCENMYAVCFLWYCVTDTQPILKYQALK